MKTNLMIDPDYLADEIKEQLENWQGGELRRELNEAVKETAKYGANLLKKGGSYKERSGEYTKAWRAKQNKKAYEPITHTETYTIHNGKHGRLTHLLENGHASRNGGRVKAYEHIAPAQELIEQMLITNINERLGS